MNIDGVLAVVLLVLMAATAYAFLGRQRLPGYDFRAFMKVRRRWWLGPTLVALTLLGLPVAFTQGSSATPFIYSLF